MMISDEDILLIQKFIEGDLSEIEQVTFKSQMASSEEFAKQVSFQRKVLAQLEATKKNDSKEKMLVDFREVQRVKSRTKMKWYVMAASLSLFFIFFLWQTLQISEHEQLFKSYYKPYDGIILNRGEYQPVIRGINAYNSGEYNTALEIFTNEKKGKLTDGQHYLLIGNCYLNLEEIDSSLVWFNKISDQETSLIKSNKDWYIALALLKKGEIKKSSAKLKLLSKSKAPYSQKASELLSESIFN